MGEKTREFEEEFAGYVGARYAIFVDSGTSALDLGLKWLIHASKILIGIRVPSLTFTSTAEVLVHNKFEIFFGDVSRRDFCLEEVSKSTLPVHLTGNKAKGDALIYDSAHRIERNDVKDSNALWCYSFYATKNMTTIQGGMIATNDKEANIWLRKARDHGLSQGTIERYKEGKWRYEVEFVGWREKSDDLHAAVGLEQLKKLDWMNERRAEIIRLYNGVFDIERTGNHLYPILVNHREEFMEFMDANGIQCSVHFLPLHRMSAYKSYGRDDLKNTEYLGDRLVSIPLYPSLQDEEISYVIQKVKESNLLIRE